MKTAILLFTLALFSACIQAQPTPREYKAGHGTTLAQHYTCNAAEALYWQIDSLEMILQLSNQPTRYQLPDHISLLFVPVTPSGDSLRLFVTSGIGKTSPDSEYLATLTINVPANQYPQLTAHAARKNLANFREKNGK